MDKSTVRLKFRVVAFIVLVLGLIAAIIMDVVGSSSEAFRMAYASIVVPMSALIVADYATKPS